MKKRINYILSALLILILIFNIKIVSGVNLGNDERTKSAVIKQLNFLEHELKLNDLGVEMQKLFPEGFFFANVLYGLTWSELALSYDLDSVQYDKAFEESQYAFQQIDSDFGRSIFSAEMAPAYGAFYIGWKNYLLGKMLSFHSTNELDSLQFTENCEIISGALSESSTPYLQSYPSFAWPADIFMCIASLKIHDQLFKPKYENTIKLWIESVRKHLDPYTGLIPHSVDPETAEPLEGARGSSISLILRVLSEIDYTFAKEQFELYREYFAIHRLGVPAISEYPKGVDGRGDVDSGPVIWDVGFSGTIVSIGTYKAMGDFRTATRISRAMEGYGFSYTIKKRKRYLFGSLPIADAFIAWSRVARCARDS